MRATLARTWFGLTALLVLTGIVTQLVVAAGASEGARFNPAAARVLNVLAYFTIQSNLLVGFTTALLAVRLDRPSTLYRTFRHIGLVAITITGIVFPIALAPLYAFLGGAQVANVLLHYVVPAMAVLGWLAFGPGARPPGAWWHSRCCTSPPTPP